MKIAVPVTEFGQIDDHFGHCEEYQVFTISDENKIAGLKTIRSELGCGCKSNIAGTLAAAGVKIMLAGGIGAGAIQVLNAEGIEVIRGCSGEAEDVVNQYLSGKISDNGQSCLHHEHHHDHGHEDGHVCSH